MSPKEVNYHSWFELESLGFKENEGTITFVQSYRMGNSFPNPIYEDDILLASNDVNLL